MSSGIQSAFRWELNFLERGKRWQAEQGGYKGHKQDNKQAMSATTVEGVGGFGKNI